MRKYSLNQDFFSVSNPESDYWAGFIAADGCISKNNTTLHLGAKDAAHAQDFLNAVSTDRPLYVYPNGTVSANISSRKIVADLGNRYGITARKTWTLRFPNLKDPLGFIAGYIDGDGCWDKHKIRGQNYDYLRLQIEGNQEFLASINSKLGGEGTVVIRSDRNSEHAYLRFVGMKAKRVDNLLSGLGRLSRKWYDREYRSLAS